LKGAPGRLDLVGQSQVGAPVFVDYAHTPDALENVLRTLRPLTKSKLSVVFGCGGDRDAGKRPMMGKVAVELADRVYVTDDNPRTEDPARIRAQIMVAAKGATEIGNRAEAILKATQDLKAGDVLLVAGKGHEQGQIIGKEKRPFSDHDAVRSAIRGVLYHG
jgi:UDP-N-acetylmuramoyl-L-alanyl-D-glutamate--2,6-diaminopimelate ligase